MNDIDEQKNLNSLSEKIREFGRNRCKYSEKDGGAVNIFFANCNIFGEILESYGEMC